MTERQWISLADFNFHVWIQYEQSWLFSVDNHSMLLITLSRKRENEWLPIGDDVDLFDYSIMSSMLWSRRALLLLLTSTRCLKTSFYQAAMLMRNCPPARRGIILYHSIKPRCWCEIVHQHEAVLYCTVIVPGISDSLMEGGIGVGRQAGVALSGK